MALPNPNDTSKLQVTYFGQLDVVIPASSSIQTQKLQTTFFGQVAAGNDFVTSGPPASNIFAINIGDVWKTGTAMQINIGDVWKNVVSVKINVGDSWKTLF